MNVDLIPELGQAIYDAASSGKLAQPEALAAIMALFPKCPYCGQHGVWGAVIAKEDDSFGAALIGPNDYWSADFASQELADAELRKRGAAIETNDCGRLN